MITVRDIYNAIDRNVPFSSAEKWDNCGMLAGDMNAEVTRVLTALDITADVIAEARSKNAQLIVSHHPVIFSPLKSVYASSPVGMLMSSGISAICVHTPFDMADCGMNKGLYDLLSEPLGFVDMGEPLEQLGENMTIGKIYDMIEPLTAAQTAERLKNALDCTCVRYTALNKPIKRIAVSSGSGNSFVDIAAQKGADALVSGDFKHDVLVDAKNSGFILFDCGHYHTERIFCGLMKKLLEEEFPRLEVMGAESCTDPVDYAL